MIRTHRWRALLVATLLAPVMLVGCNSGSSAGKGGELENIPWKLTNYFAADTLESVASGVNVFAEFKDGRVSGRALNTYSATYEATADGKLTIGQIQSTLMAGPQDQMDAEQAYFDALQKSASYTSDGATLKIFDAEGNELLIYAKSEVSLVGKWDVTGYNNGKEAVTSLVADSVITMEFAEGDALSGNAGVNQFNGAYTTSGTDGITIGTLATTQMAGPDDLMAQEQQFLAALATVKTYEIMGDTLTMRDASGATQVTATAAK